MPPKRRRQPAPTSAPQPPAPRADTESVVARARAGDESAVPALRRLLRDEPALVAQLGGDLAMQAVASLVEKAAGADVAFREALFRRLGEIRDELSGPSPSPLERLLVQRVMVTWLSLHLAEVQAAQAEGGSASAAEYRERRIDRLNRRYLLALKTLASVRRLGPRVLQVFNIAPPAGGGQPAPEPLRSRCAPEKT